MYCAYRKCLCVWGNRPGELCLVNAAQEGVRGWLRGFPIKSLLKIIENHWKLFESAEPEAGQWLGLARLPSAARLWARRRFGTTPKFNSRQDAQTTSNMKQKRDYKLSFCPFCFLLFQALLLAKRQFKAALDQSGREWSLNPGDGAFYGALEDFDALFLWQSRFVKLHDTPFTEQGLVQHIFWAYLATPSIRGPKIDIRPA